MTNEGVLSTKWLSNPDLSVFSISKTRGKATFITRFSEKVFPPRFSISKYDHQKKKLVKTEQKIVWYCEIFAPKQDNKDHKDFLISLFRKKKNS